jgi:glyoxylase-like metal-dependent hydrolase (beta-lactamase superfamily II)
MEASLRRISEHVWWLPPGPPDRPSLCAAVGAGDVLALDAGASAAHARLFLDGLAREGIGRPRYVALTHSHWDHVFGAAELEASVIAHVSTAEYLAELADYEWTDEALEERLAAGAVSPEHVAHVKEELPAPRDVRIASVDTVFRETLDLDLGGVTVRVQHVGGDHAPDSTVMYVAPDRLLFLGDSLYDATDGSERYLTRRKTFPLLDAVLAFDAELYVEGHAEAVMPRSEAEELARKMRLAGSLVARLDAAGSDLDEATVLAAAQAEAGEAPDDETIEVVRAFLIGRSHEGPA